MAHTFRLATSQDIPFILDFLKKNWNKDHIFLRNQDLFLWQYQSDKSSLNFMLAIQEDTEEIAALIGFIPTSRFDPALDAEKDVWGAIWKNAQGKGLVGLQLLLKMQETLGVKSYAGIGLSHEAQDIYRQLGYLVGDMEHYFIPVQDGDLRIASTQQRSLPKQIYPDAVLRKVTPEEVVNSEIKSVKHPKKTPRYIYERYATHPVYEYEFYEVSASGSAPAIIVIRINYVENCESACLHIVDWLGAWDTPIDLRKGILSLLNEKRCEYADLICRVETKGHFTQMGFKIKNSEKETVPLHFSPFNKNNIPLHYVIKTEHPNFALFKGDADQDRPN